MGIHPAVGGHDTGYRLDCEKLFDKADRPADPLAWFDMDGPWFKKHARHTTRLCAMKRALADAREKAGSSEQDAYWFAPVPRPGKIICIGLNYRDHAAESNMPIPGKAGDVFEVFDCVIAPGEPVVLPSTSQQVDYEAELAVVIGRRAKHVNADRAYDYVLGYTAFNDVTRARFSICGWAVATRKIVRHVCADGPDDRHHRCDSGSAQALDQAHAQRPDDAGLKHGSTDLWCSGVDRVYHRSRSRSNPAM